MRSIVSIGGALFGLNQVLAQKRFHNELYYENAKINYKLGRIQGQRDVIACLPKKSEPEQARQSGQDKLTSGDIEKGKTMATQPDPNETRNGVTVGTRARDFRDDFRRQCEGEFGDVYLSVIRAELIRHDGRIGL